MKAQLEDMMRRANADPRYVAQGGHLTLSFKLDVGENQYWLVDIEKGKVTGLRAGPVLMPDYRFSIRCAERHWHEHWKPRPKPGWQDLFGMQRHHGLVIEGDIHLVVTNLFWFKDLLAMPRSSSGASAAVEAA